MYLNTVLVEGTNYYVTQTVNCIESLVRLALIVQLPLALPDNELLQIYYSPNPVKNILKLQSNTVIKSVLVYTMLGQQVLKKFYNDMLLLFNLTNLNTGNYIVKVESETGEKILRIIRE